MKDDSVENVSVFLQTTFTKSKLMGAAMLHSGRSEKLK